MAKNKITFAKEYDAIGNRTKYYFTGSQRMPTLIEVQDFIQEKHLADEMDDYFGIAHINLKPEEWVPPEECRTLTLLGYDGGTNYGSCPVCGHEREMSGDTCPVCLRKWDE